MPPSSRSLRFAQSITLISGAALAGPAIPAVALTSAALVLDACSQSAGTAAAPDRDARSAGISDAPTQDAIPDATLDAGTDTPPVTDAGISPSPDAPDGGEPG